MGNTAMEFEEWEGSRRLLGSIVYLHAEQVRFPSSIDARPPPASADGEFQLTEPLLAEVLSFLQGHPRAHGHGLQQPDSIVALRQGRDWASFDACVSGRPDR